MYSAMHILLFGLICDPDHLCFGRTTYNNINGPGGPFMLVIIGPAGPFMYPDQISRYSTRDYLVCLYSNVPYYIVKNPS